MEKLKRYLVFFIGLFINAMGVSLITKANLGTSPISSIPYVLSLNFTPTLGQFTIMFSLLLIGLQILMLRKKFKIEDFLQIPISIIFGYFIDLTMILLQFINPQSYVLSVLYLLIGCVILGFGVYMEVLADVTMLPGESFVRAVTMTLKTEFGATKIVFDVSMTVIAGCLSIVFAGGLLGIREGTVIAALLVGFIARLFGRALAFVRPKLFPQTKEAVPVHGKSSKAPTYIIAIGRQYGCGAREIGKLLADKLGFDFYDQEIIEKAAGITGRTSQFVSKQEEKMTNSLLYDLVNHMYAYAPDQTTPKDDVYEAEVKVICDLAKGGNCVIMGRCADDILRNYPNCLRVWLFAPDEFRINYVMKQENIDSRESKTRIEQEDRRRANNYRYYTRQIWGLAKNYHVSVDTEFGAEFAIHQIVNVFKIWSKKVKENKA